jgi:hypothetical protein
MQIDERDGAGHARGEVFWVGGGLHEKVCGATCLLLYFFVIIYLC